MYYYAYLQAGLLNEIFLYCNVFGFLKTRFGLVIGFINNPQVVNYN
jgi:hypothetical protein